MFRRVVFSIGIAAGAVLLLAGGLVAWVALGDARVLAERAATWAIGRPVTLAGLSVDLGSPITFELRGFHLANAPWGTAPSMIEARRVSGRVDPWSLLNGPVRFRMLRIEDLAIRLERGPDHVGNWHLRDGTARSGRPPSASRTTFPTLLDFTLERGRLTFRTSGGNQLRVDAREWTIAATDSQSPVGMSFDGAYGGNPVRLQATTGSFEVLHQPDEPFRAEIDIRADPGALRFEGTLQEPLSVDRAAGRMSIKARDLGRLFAIFGAGFEAPVPVELAGAFSRNGDDWRLTDAKGPLAGMPASATLRLVEGSAAKPDTVELAFGFERLDLDRLLARIGAGGDPSLRLDDDQAPRLAIRLTAQRLDYAGLGFSDLALSARATNRRAELQTVSVKLWGGTATGRMVATTVAEGTRLEGTLTATGIDAGTLAADIELPPAQISGRMDAAVALTGTGATLGQAVQSSQGSAALAVRQGRIATSLLERASLDLRALVRRNETDTPIDCLLAVARLHGGVGTLMPLRLRTPGADFDGAGSVDLAAERLDVTIRSERSSTGPLALDLPLHVSGPFDAIDVVPARHAPQRAEPDGAVEALPAPVATLVQGSGCGA